MHRTPTGALALACAAVDDVLAWIMLAVVLAVIRSSGAGDLVTMVVESVGFVLVMFWVVRPQLRLLLRWRNAAGRLTPDVFAIVLVGVLVCSYLTDKIGIHAIFGAFIFGAILPPESPIARHLALHRTPVVTMLFLPAFFALTGLRTEIGLLSGARDWTICALVIVIATAGKFGGTAVAARLAGMRWRFAAELGALMNTRGLMELVVLNVGLDLGVISPRLFTMMVMMAIVTTAMTAPLLDLLRDRSR
jgi:Kef-type K+ transport system membrane component KefB